MESIAFNSSAGMTLGAEIEIQLLDSDSYNLLSVAPKIFAELGNDDPQIKAEIMQNMLEINTKIRNNAHEIEQDLLEKIKLVESIAYPMGVRMAMSGTHPFGRYAETLLSPQGRFQDLIDRNQWVARRLMIFGLHVHIGMRDGNHCIQMNNALLNYLPILLALSASSPYWQGTDTGLASCRVTAFEIIPTGGCPCLVQSWDEFQKLCSLMVRSESITALKDIWWDARPSPKYGTLEIRICDGLPSLQEIASMVALIHCLCLWVDSQLSEGKSLPAPDLWILRENKWRASRHGPEMKMVINSAGDTKPFPAVIHQLFAELRPWVQKFAYEKEFENIMEALSKGISCQRQRAIAADSIDLIPVVRKLAEEFEGRKPIWK